MYINTYYYRKYIILYYIIYNNRLSYNTVLFVFNMLALLSYLLIFFQYLM